MIRMQDIADMAGVSRTTVSNVLHGNTKRVSQETIDRIKKIVEENEYQPNIGSMMLTGQGSKIIGFVLGYEYIHGYPATMDSFIGELLSAVQSEAEKLGYYIMIIGGSSEKRVLDIASRWNVEGLIFIGYSEGRYHQLRRKLNKKAVLVDTYTLQKEYDYQNVGIDDYRGGYLAGEYLYEMGYPNALFIAEETQVRANETIHKIQSDKAFSGLCNEKRWQGFKAAMEKKGGFCSIRRFVVVA
ncbi:MAG: LacI family DNA-binding transcriptional regulator [Eubacteriales bacterium]|nr:LacI family DNA-binding transcriptional regulator [Eubacteriales bacterium]